jgi:pyruvate dehydrogenase E2 component (dihydrolipoyllysine-residue acetyltransferase)
MPQISLGDEEVIVVRWHKAVGETVALGEPVLEVETEKANMDVEAPVAGTLSAQHCAVGDTVAPGGVIGYVTAGDEPTEQIVGSLAADVARSRVYAGELGNPEVPSKAATRPTVLDSLVSSGELRGLPRLVTPTAPGNEVRESFRPSSTGAYSDRPLSRRRRAIARRLSQAASIPQFAVTRTIALEAARRDVESLRAAGNPATLTDVVVRAVAAAAVDRQVVNAWLVDDMLRIFEHVALALAVETDDGVIAPVIRNADQLELAEIAVCRADLVERARSGRLRSNELDDATLTLTNIGPIGGDLLLPVLTPPQVGVIGVGRDTSGSATFTFVGDHRALDGADGARYLVHLEDAFHAHTSG